MAINATVDGVTYSGIDTINTGGKVIGLTEAGGAGEIVDKTVTAFENSEITTIGAYAFWGCSNLSEVSCAEVLSVMQSAFEKCSALMSVNLPKATFAGVNAFNGAPFSYVSFPALTSISAYAFRSCLSLVSADFPNLERGGIGNEFQGCRLLETINVPKLASFSDGFFHTCISLREISLPSAQRIPNTCFFDDVRLLSLYLPGSSVVPLMASAALQSTPIAGNITVTGVLGSIYVPASLLTAYQSATNWAFFSERLVGV